MLELPPNTQGIVALEMLNILEGFDLKALGHNSAAYLHLLVEAKRIAFADRAAWLADCDAVPPGVLETLRSKEYAAARRKEIDPNRAAADYRPLERGGAAPPRREPRARRSGDTIYLTVADRDGNVVSLIQSIFEIVRRRHRRPARPASRCTTAAACSRCSRDIPTCWHRASGRCTRSCRRWC